MRDLSGRKAADSSQRQNNLCLTRKCWMATGKHQTRTIIWLWCYRVLQQGELITITRITSELVDGSSASRCHQPCSGLFRDALVWPALKGNEQNVLDDFFGNLEVTQKT